MSSSSPLPWIIGISGASGTIYARRLLSILAIRFPEQALEVVISEGALRVFQEEDKLNPKSDKIETIVGHPAPNIRLHNNRDTGANIASGSFRTAGMVVVPCSMGTVGALASGFADNLLRRAADVQLKEGRRLILVPRETPLSTLHLENLLKLSKLGVTIAPAMPGFYLQPESVEELVDQVVYRLLDLMGLSLPGSKRWGDE